MREEGLTCELDERISDEFINQTDISKFKAKIHTELNDRQSTAPAAYSTHTSINTKEASECFLDSTLNTEDRRSELMH